jgi:hypothetical protein
LAKQFQRRIFLESNQSKTRIACLLMDQNEMSNLYRGPFIDASLVVLTKFHIIWPSGFREKAVSEIEQ